MEPAKLKAAKRLANEHIEIDVLPELGGKIWNLTRKSTGTQWIWHNPKVPPKAAARDASYDDNWAGGWEELFPNDSLGRFDGRDLPDHGEWWNSVWTWDASPDGRSCRMTLDCTSIKARCEKTIRIGEGAEVTVAYRIENRENEKIRFLFKQHLAVAVTPDHVIELPGGTVLQVDPGFSTRMTGPGPYPWPDVPGPSGRTEDLSVLPPPEDRHREFVYVNDLPEGWCGVKNTRTGERIRMHFPRDVFPSTWLFMSFGGWRDLYTAVLEPCTNHPKDIASAAEKGFCATLEPGAALTCEVTVELS